MEVIQLFPTEIYQFNIPENIIDGARAELDNYYKKTLDKSYSTAYYTNYDVQDQLIVGEFTKNIHQLIEISSHKLFKERYTITHSWSNYTPKHVTHSLHRHGNSNGGSAIVYFDNIGQTNFLDPREQVYNFEPFQSKAEKGKCVIFPSWLMHEVPHHNEDTLRVTMAFNMLRNRIRDEFK